MDEKIKKNADWLREFILKPASWFVIGFAIASILSYFLYENNKELKIVLKNEKKLLEEEIKEERSLRYNSDKQTEKWQTLYYTSKDSCAEQLIKNYIILQKLINLSNLRADKQINSDNEALFEIKNKTEEIKNLIK